MNPEQQTECRYFVSYSGIKLPLKLVNEITEDDEVREIHFNELGEMV